MKLYCHHHIYKEPIPERATFPTLKQSIFPLLMQKVITLTDEEEKQLQWLFPQTSSHQVRKLKNKFFYQEISI